MAVTSGKRLASGRLVTDHKKRKPGFGCRVFSLSLVSYRRGGQIRTADLSDPNRARYQTALRPETEAADNGPQGAICQG